MAGLTHIKTLLLFPALHMFAGMTIEGSAAGLWRTYGHWKSGKFQYASALAIMGSVVDRSVVL